jgi:pimeloyl-ACP methyl ester carboxylesterase
LLDLAQRADLAALRLGLWLDLDAAMLALALAARHPARVGAVVSVNPRLQGDAPVLGGVQAATLLVRLGADEAQALAQQQAMLHLHCRKRLEQVPLSARGAADDGAADAVAQIAADWLATHLPYAHGV